MTRLPQLCQPSLALLTDLHQLMMAFGSFKTGATRKDASFSFFFREHPFRGGFTVACGLGSVLDFLDRLTFQLDDLDYLSTLRGNDGEPLFDDHFLDYLRQLRLECDVHAVPEGTVMFPFEPLVRVTGPLLQAQLLETALLNMLNFQTLIATKAARVCAASRGQPVLEFGMRHAQGFDGALSASRAAYIGGVGATSNVLAGRLYGIPVSGTHTHSWVMAFDDEEEAFVAYAAVLPANCVFLVDTYDTLEGVKRAVRVGRELRRRGHEMVGVRLDSGDLTSLSVEARRILDQSGFPEATIVAGSDLDEWLIQNLSQQGARIDVWGVGSKLATAFDQPALEGVYELSAIREPGGNWQPRVKFDERSAKVSNPGVHQVRRYRGPDGFVADAIYDSVTPIRAGCTIVDPHDRTHRRELSDDLDFEDLLVPVFVQGQRTYESPTLEESRERVQTQLALLNDGAKRFLNPHRYLVGLEQSLYELKVHLVLEARS